MFQRFQWLDEESISKHVRPVIHQYRSPWQWASSNNLMALIDALISVDLFALMKETKIAVAVLGINPVLHSKWKRTNMQAGKDENNRWLREQKAHLFPQRWALGANKPNRMENNNCLFVTFNFSIEKVAIWCSMPCVALFSLNLAKTSVQRAGHDFHWVNISARFPCVSLVEFEIRLL